MNNNTTYKQHAVIDASKASPEKLKLATRSGDQHAAAWRLREIRLANTEESRNNIDSAQKTADAFASIKEEIRREQELSRSLQ